MKIKKIVLGLVICLFIFTLSGCFSAEKDVLTGTMLQEMLVRQGKVSKKDVNYQSINTNMSFSSYSKDIIIDARDGIFILQDGYSRQYKFYSLITGKNFKNISSSTFYSVKETSFGTFIEVYEYGYTYIFDVYGNCLLDENSNGTVDFGSEEYEGENYLKIFLNGNLYGYYAYDNYYNVTKKDRLGEIKEGSVIGYPMVDYKSLYNDYGINGYYIDANDRLMIYDKNQEFDFVIQLPDNYRDYYFIGNKLYYFSLDELPEDEEDYDLTIDGRKYNYEIKSVDLTNGNKKEEKLDYVIFESTHLGNLKSQNYSVVTIKRIEKDKTLGAQEVWVTNKNGKLIQNITHLFPEGISNLLLINESILDLNKGMLFDKNLNVLACVENINRVVGNCIIFGNELKGIVNSRGLLMCQQEFDSVVSVGENYAIVRKNGHTYRVNLVYGTVEDFKEYSSTEVPNLYSKTSGNQVQFYSIEGTLIHSFYEYNSYNAYSKAYYYNPVSKTYSYYIVNVNYNDYNAHITGSTCITYR